MIDDAVRLLPFLAVDIVNPVLFACMVYATGSNRPILASSMLLLGHTLAYFLFGIVAALGFEHAAAYLANPRRRAATNQPACDSRHARLR